jgi:hypothetical protein
MRSLRSISVVTVGLALLASCGSPAAIRVSAPSVATLPAPTTTETYLRRDMTASAVPSELAASFRSYLEKALPKEAFISYVAEDQNPLGERVLIALFELSPGDGYSLEVSFNTKVPAEKKSYGWPGPDGGTYELSVATKDGDTVTISKNQSFKSAPIAENVARGHLRSLAAHVENFLRKQTASSPVTQPKPVAPPA